MTDFKAKMHQIRFRLGDPAGGAYSAPQTPLLDLVAASRQGEGWEEEGKREGKGREGEVEGRERFGLQVTVEPGPLRDLLRHWVTSQILMLPGLNKLTSIIVNIVFTM